MAQAEILYRNGKSEWLAPAAFRYSYRTLQPPKNFCGFLAARFRVTEDVDGEHARHTKESLAKRKASQPVGRPSAGSTFRNPPGDHAARLIEACGLKGHRIGLAQVSAHHANFLITEPGARAEIARMGCRVARLRTCSTSSWSDAERCVHGVKETCWEFER